LERFFWQKIPGRMNYSSHQKGLNVMETMEEAEEEFVETMLLGPAEKLDSVLSVINTRARAFATLIDYLAHRTKG
jgi:hypothetical protein